MTNQRKVLVIGAGFSGLAAAHHLSRAGYDVHVHEASERAGGLLGTSRMASGQALAEHAANGVLNSALVEDLFEAAGVEMIPTLKEARARYIVRDGKLRRWPLSFFENFRIIKFLFTYVFMRSALAPKPKETIGAWGRRVLSPSVSLYTIETALQGIYAGDPERLSASLILERFFSEQSRASKKPVKIKGTVSARGGMQELIDGLRAALEKRGVHFHFNSKFSSDDLAKTSCPVVVATDAPAATALLKGADAERAAALSRVQLLPIISVTALFPQGSFIKKGFGYLFSPRTVFHQKKMARPIGSNRNNRTLPSDKRAALANSAKSNLPVTPPPPFVLGVLMNNWIFPERTSDHMLSETWILGGAFADSGLVKRSDEELTNIIVSERAKLAGQDVQPIEVRIQRWPQALPHIEIQLESSMPLIRKSRRNIFLIGNYTGGIGLTKILDQAEELVAKIKEDGCWEQKREHASR